MRRSSAVSFELVEIEVLDGDPELAGECSSVSSRGCCLASLPAAKRAGVDTDSIGDRVRGKGRGVLRGKGLPELLDPSHATIVGPGLCSRRCPVVCWSHPSGHLELKCPVAWIKGNDSVTDRTTQVLEWAVLGVAPLVAFAAGYDSYSSLVEVAREVGGYAEHEAQVYPAAIDLTLGGSIAASWLLVRWGAPGRARAVVTLMITGSAILTVSGNALHGWLVAGHLAAPWVLRAAVSAVPGAAIVGVTHQVVLVLRHRPHRVAARPAGEVSSPEARLRRAPRRMARATSAPKQAHVRALLEEREVGNLVGQARADVISSVARETRSSAQYVRRLARGLRTSGEAESGGEGTAA